MQRYLADIIEKDLRRKMVFVAGPRQVGKTTLAKSLLGARDLYLNWDIPLDRKQILERRLPSRGILVLDEIHRMRSWRDYLKGLFDERGKDLRILVTGSAKLDLYRFKGDSLQGRYHMHRLFPLSIKELDEKDRDLTKLLTFSGFPEPFFARDKSFSRRWSSDYRSRLVNEEITSIEQISDLAKLELLAIRLPELVGSPLSLNALREDLEVAHATVARWIEILERFYGIVKVSPFGAPKIRAVKKEQKHYHLDWSLVPDPGARLENLVAIHLLKWVNFERDTEGRALELRYFRDIDGREVDFILTENRKPILAVEVKSSKLDLHPGLVYFKKKFPTVEAVQLHLGPQNYVTKEDIAITPVAEFLLRLV